MLHNIIILIKHNDAVNIIFLFILPYHNLPLAMPSPKRFLIVL